QTLEAVGIGARLVGATAEQADAPGGQESGGLHDLLARFDGAGTGNQDRGVVGADADIAQADDRVLGVALAGRQVGLLLLLLLQVHAGLKYLLEETVYRGVRKRALVGSRK